MNPLLEWYIAGLIGASVLKLILGYKWAEVPFFAVAGWIILGVAALKIIGIVFCLIPRYENRPDPIEDDDDEESAADLYLKLGNLLGLNENNKGKGH